MATTKPTTKAAKKPDTAAKRSRKSGGAISAGAKYALASMTTSLSFSGPSIREERDCTTFSDDGVVVATMQLVGEELVIDFAAPASLEPFARVMSHYQKVDGKPGWLRFRRPGTRDPRPSLEADFGAVMGAARNERRAKSKGK